MHDVIAHTASDGTSNIKRDEMAIVASSHLAAGAPSLAQQRQQAPTDAQSTVAAAATGHAPTAAAARCGCTAKRAADSAGT